MLVIKIIIGFIQNLNENCCPSTFQLQTWRKMQTKNMAVGLRRVQCMDLNFPAFAFYFVVNNDYNRLLSEVAVIAIFHVTLHVARSVIRSNASSVMRVLWWPHQHYFFQKQVFTVFDLQYHIFWTALPTHQTFFLCTTFNTTFMLQCARNITIKNSDWHKKNTVISRDFG